MVSHGENRRASCPARGVTDLAVGSSDWLGWAHQRLVKSKTKQLISSYTTKRRILRKSKLRKAAYRRGTKSVIQTLGFRRLCKTLSVENHKTNHTSNRTRPIICPPNQALNRVNRQGLPLFRRLRATKNAMTPATSPTGNIADPAASALLGWKNGMIRAVRTPNTTKVTSAMTTGCFIS